mmetsp:Transcript_54009/g.120839  ORF Transcript_54009/g.120839 Transcript_54009/m.120839 type:complete len:175 (-) Transcript_54009:221-745(-)
MAVRNVVMGLVMLGLGILPVVAGSNASAASALRGSAAQIEQNNTGDAALEVKDADATFAMGIGNESNANTSSQPQILKITKSAARWAATAFVNANFGGASLAIHRGSISNVGDLWNDEITSLIIYPQWCVRLFENTNFKGASRKYCAGNKWHRISNVGSSFNDKTSSIKAWARR